MNNLFAKISLFVITIVVIIAMLILMAYPTMWLWNWVMPTIFGLTKITFWQAFGINLLSSLLFKSPNNVKK